MENGSIDINDVNQIYKNQEIVDGLKELLKGATDGFSFTGKQLRTEILGEK